MIFDGDREYIGLYLRFLADNVGLRDWTLAFPSEQPDDDRWAASCETIYGRKIANICFTDGWEHTEEGDFRATCVHELMHCHINIVWEPLNAISEIVGIQVYGPAHDGMRLHMEHAIDAIASEWSRHLPLPSEWLEHETAPGED